MFALAFLEYFGKLRGKTYSRKIFMGKGILLYYIFIHFSICLPTSQVELFIDCYPCKSEPVKSPKLPNE